MKGVVFFAFLALATTVVGQALFLDEDEVYEVNVASDRLRVITEVNGALHVVEGDVSGHNRLHSRALGVNVGDEVLIINTKDNTTAGSNAGEYGIHTVTAVNATSGEITVTPPLQHTYPTDGSQVVKCEKFDNITMSARSIIRPVERFDGETGGILCLLVSGDVIMGTDAAIHADGFGYRGGEGRDETGPGFPGEGQNYYTAPVAGSTTMDMGGAGGATQDPFAGVIIDICYFPATGGGGGGYVYSGNKAYSSLCNSIFSAGGEAYDGTADARATLSTADVLLFGGGGGGAAAYNPTATGLECADGGRGGGIIYLTVGGALRGSGRISVNGDDGANNENDASCGGAGGGAGGTIFLQVSGARWGDIVFQSNGGSGSNGNVRLADDGNFVAGEYKGLSGGDGSRGWIRYNGPQCLAPDWLRQSPSPVSLTDYYEIESSSMWWNTYDNPTSVSGGSISTTCPFIYQALLDQVADESEFQPAVVVMQVETSAVNDNHCDENSDCSGSNTCIDFRCQAPSPEYGPCDVGDDADCAGSGQCFLEKCVDLVPAALPDSAGEVLVDLRASPKDFTSAGDAVRTNTWTNRGTLGGVFSNEGANEATVKTCPGADDSNKFWEIQVNDVLTGDQEIPVELQGAGDRTVSFWYRTFAATTLIEYGQDAGLNDCELFTLQTNDEGNEAFTSGGDDCILNAPIDMDDGEWHYAVVTYNFATTTLTLVVDGVSTDRDDINLLTFTDANDRITLFSNAFNGGVVMVRIESGSLSVDDINTNYAKFQKVLGSGQGLPCDVDNDCAGTCVNNFCQEDCNSNGIADFLDVEAGNDANGNGIPDDCEGTFTLPTPSDPVLQFSVHTISSVNGNSVSIDGATSVACSGGGCQVVGMFSFQTLVVSSDAEVTAPAFRGEDGDPDSGLGGVIAFAAQVVENYGAMIVPAGSGFFGGEANIFGAKEQDAKGYQGRSFVSTDDYKRRSNFAWFSGGGGAQLHNGGDCTCVSGGGGGGYGQEAFTSTANGDCSPQIDWAQGGVNYTSTPTFTRSTETSLTGSGSGVYFGSGGGSGAAENYYIDQFAESGTGGAGGRGGGAIFIFCDHHEGGGIYSTQGSAGSGAEVAITNSEFVTGGGGGGAGGTVALFAQSRCDAPVVRINGGQRGESVPVDRAEGSDGAVGVTTTLPADGRDVDENAVWTVSPATLPDRICGSIEVIVNYTTIGCVHELYVELDFGVAQTDREDNFVQVYPGNGGEQRFTISCTEIKMPLTVKITEGDDNVIYDQTTFCMGAISLTGPSEATVGTDGVDFTIELQPPPTPFIGITDIRVSPEPPIAFPVPNEMDFGVNQQNGFFSLETDEGSAVGLTTLRIYDFKPNEYCELQYNFTVLGVISSAIGDTPLEGATMGEGVTEEVCVTIKPFAGPLTNDGFVNVSIDASAAGSASEDFLVFEIGQETLCYDLTPEQSGSVSVVYSAEFYETKTETFNVIGAIFVNTPDEMRVGGQYEIQISLNPAPEGSPVTVNIVTSGSGSIEVPATLEFAPGNPLVQTLYNATDDGDVTISYSATGYLDLQETITVVNETCPEGTITVGAGTTCGPCPSVDGEVCSSHGTCVLSSVNPFLAACDCEDGFLGVACDIEDASPAPGSSPAPAPGSSPAPAPGSSVPGLVIQPIDAGQQAMLPVGGPLLGGTQITITLPPLDQFTRAIVQTGTDYSAYVDPTLDPPTVDGENYSANYRGGSLPGFSFQRLYDDNAPIATKNEQIPGNPIQIVVQFLRNQISDNDFAALDLFYFDTWVPAFQTCPPGSRLLIRDLQRLRFTVNVCTVGQFQFFIQLPSPIVFGEIEDLPFDQTIVPSIPSRAYIVADGEQVSVPPQPKFPQVDRSGSPNQKIEFPPTTSSYSAQLSAANSVRSMTSLVALLSMLALLFVLF